MYPPIKEIPMSDFNTINEWVNTHLSTIDESSDITIDMLKEIEAFADEEVESLSKRVHRILIDRSGKNAMQALSTITLNNNRPYSDDYMDNALAAVLVKPDPYTTDGLFVIVQIVPNRYVLKTIIRTDNKWKVRGVTHTYLNLFTSDRTKPFMKTGTRNGPQQIAIFEHKAKHDKKERIDPPEELGNNDPFTITQPDGTVVQP